MNPPAITKDYLAEKRWVFYRTGKGRRQRAGLLVEQEWNGLCKIVKNSRAAWVHMSELEPPNKRHACWIHTGWPTHPHNWEI